MDVNVDAAIFIEKISMSEINKVALSGRAIAIVTGLSLFFMAGVAIYTTLILQQLMLPTSNMVNLLEGNLKKSILGWLGIFIADIIVAWGLYVLMKKSSHSLSLLTAMLRLAYTLFLGGAISFLVVALITVNKSSPFHPDLDNAHLDKVTRLFIHGFNEIWSLGLIAFGLHLCSLGLLIYRSTFLPRFLGVVILIAGVGYIITNSGSLIIADFKEYRSTVEMIFIPSMILGELGLAAWLLFRGGKEKNTISL